MHAFDLQPPKKHSYPNTIRALVQRKPLCHPHGLMITCPKQPAEQKNVGNAGPLPRLVFRTSSSGSPAVESITT